MTISNVPARPQQTALATQDTMPQWLAKPLEQYLNNPNFNLVIPAIPVNAELGWGHRVSVSIVKIDPDETYAIQGKLNYSKSALEKLSIAAGMNIDTNRIDDRSDRDYCEVKAQAVMKDSSGQWVRRSMSKAFDMPAVIASSGKPATDRDNVLFRRFLLARTESGAMTRVVRHFLALKGNLTAEHIAKPYVVARIEFNPDPSDPEVKRFLLEQGFRSEKALFGPGERGAERSGAVVEEVEPDDEETEQAREAREQRRATGVTPSPIGELSLGTPPAGDSQVDYDALIYQGAMILGLSKKEREALFEKHTVNGARDVRAIHNELSRLVAEKEGGK